MKSEHTPGPWTAHGPDNYRQMADATLIAEAPAMRAALQLLVDINEEWAEKQHMLDRAIDAARAVLARIDT